MTSIASSTTTQAYRPPPPHSGRGRIDDKIQQGVSSGSISATDATALTSALDSIDTSLSAQASGSVSTADSASGGTRAGRPDPAAMKEKIDGLISDQVSAGNLTSEQADTLTSLFASGGEGAGGPGRPGGPPPKGAASDTASDGSSSGSDDANAAASRLLSDFLLQLQSNLSGGSGYGATGTSRATHTGTSLVMDFDA
ncbi:MAG TPA: hypothetical protein K8W01_13995 [Methylorubrum populi]|uniref:Uncharacterized protein n=1 Tax=Methylorubrum populi TaxID=223967 RepID=A0A921E491_9HYPH|nr:hypothetical protein [Methylorubrum populi]